MDSSFSGDPYISIEQICGATRYWGQIYKLRYI